MVHDNQQIHVIKLLTTTVSSQKVSWSFAIFHTTYFQIASVYLPLFQSVQLNTCTTLCHNCNMAYTLLHLPVINIIIDKNHQSAEQAVCWWPEENVYCHGKLLTVMYAVNKRYKDSPRKFVFLQNSSPDVEREGGGGRTNISLLKSTEDWVLCSKTSTRKDRKQKTW